MYKARLVVFMDGGLIHQVLSNEPIELVIVDYDLEGLEEDEVSIVMGAEAYVHIDRASELNTEVVQQVFKDVNR
jgi:hypothetical protein